MDFHSGSRYQYELISSGGNAVGKLQQMAEFALSPQDIQNLIAFVRRYPAEPSSTRARSRRRHRLADQPRSGSAWHALGRGHHCT
jgi:hypothetical protein